MKREKKSIKEVIKSSPFYKRLRLEMDLGISSQQFYSLSKHPYLYTILTNLQYSIVLYIGFLEYFQGFRLTGILFIVLGVLMGLLILWYALLLGYYGEYFEPSKPLTFIDDSLDPMWEQLSLFSEG